MTAPQATSRVMSGMRATGELHLGHYLGVLVNWVALQQDHDCFFSVADWHMLTTGFARTEKLRDHTRAIVLDWLAAGVDPERATVYVQSHVPEIAELHLLLSMISPVNWMERDPTLKDMVRELKLGGDTFSYGLLGYPALQTADILSVGASLVPVGEDQVAHIEISRDLARRFNHLFDCEVFDEPRPLLTPTPVVFGTDGRKMSKSYGNDLKLADPPEEVLRKLKAAPTDPTRLRKTDPGHPEVCAIWATWLAQGPERAPEIASACRKGELGCMNCKKDLSQAVSERLAPMQERRAEADKPGVVAEVLAEGARKARAVAQAKLGEVREAMKLNLPPA